MTESAGVDASIIVCTYNRATSLRETLAALRLQNTLPGRTWEVVIVDNNSRDDTRGVVEQFGRAWSLLRYEFEPAQGLSHARNRGIAVARGDVLLFTDDDVLPEPDWLEQTLEGLTKYRADACGGYIAPIWEVPPPAWLTERFYGFLAIRTDRTEDYVVRNRSEAPFGANMAFRKAVFDRVGLFDTNRGRKGNVLAGGEEIDMFQRVLGAGLTAVFLAHSRVRHKVEAFRLTKRYLRRWRFQASMNLAATKGVHGSRRLFNIPLYMFPQFLRALLRAAAGWFTEPGDEAFHREMIVCHFLGTFRGLLQARRVRQ